MVRGSGFLTLPSDVTTIIPLPCQQWLKKYSLTNDEVHSLNICWSERDGMLLFPQEDDRTLLGYMGRRFKGEGSKYIIRGSKTAFKRVYGSGDKIVYTEDLISAVKVSRVCAARPLFGTSLSRLDEGYDRHILWLDKDKQSSSVVQCRHWKQYGYNIRPVITNDDPKCYNEQQIKGYLT